MKDPKAGEASLCCSWDATVGRVLHVTQLDLRDLRVQQPFFFALLRWPYHR